VVLNADERMTEVHGKCQLPRKNYLGKEKMKK
jgi:hypothetical protein